MAAGEDLHARFFQPGFQRRAFGYAGGKGRLQRFGSVAEMIEAADEPDRAAAELGDPVAEPAAIPAPAGRRRRRADCCRRAVPAALLRAFQPPPGRT